MIDNGICAENSQSVSVMEVTGNHAVGSKTATVIQVARLLLRNGHGWVTGKAIGQSETRMLVNW